ncbi:SLC13 family permease [Seohaeicola saemankumensis]|uniref:SLC13 family permease n=1 Tax=Seohaeicola TaxID=481178 RepID=UPI0035D10FA7
MTLPQMMIFGILALTMGLFLWGRLRHDVVALAALMACVVTGLVPAADAFAGFGHPAVITVACVLVLSYGLQQSGAVDRLARNILPRNAGRFATLGALMGLGALLSGFMNNVGAMALLMPIAMQVSGRLDLTPGQVLMPLAFGTILGGMTTLVGTPPNLIVSGFRADAGLEHFGMFDFAPVGVSVAVLGVIFVVFLGWRLVPARKASSAEGFETGAYLTEVRVPARAKAIGMTLRQIETDMAGADAQIVGLIRNEVKMIAPHGGRRVREGDILMLEADVEGLAEALSAFGIKLEEQGSSSDRADADDKAQKAKAQDAADRGKDAKAAKSAGKGKDSKTDTAEEDGDDDESGRREDDILLRELAVLPGSSLVGRSASDMHLRSRYGLNLLAVAREGRRPRARLRTLKLKSGDLLLMQGPADVLADFANETGCVPLGDRDLRIPDARMAVLSTAIMGGAIALVTFGVLPAAAAFALGVLVSMVVRTVPPREVYTAIDWPVIVLLAALIPVAGAMEQTGAADVLARVLVDTVAQGNAIAALAVILVVTMFLSDVMNNAATAAVMCPIALGIAATLGVNPDSFLMAVAIGASCAFLTPIGHQNNTLILGPGGFRFGDYWRLGLPLEALVVAVSLPLLLIVWPL